MSRSKQSIKREAREQAAQAVESMDLETLFGEDLYMLGYDEGYAFVHNLLYALQQQIVKGIRK